MVKIDSRDNPRIVAAAKLKEKKYRDEAGQYLVEGEKMVREALQKGLPVVEIFARESDAEAFDFLPDRAVLVAERAYAKLCDTVTPQGIVAVVKKPQTNLLAPESDCVILDGIADAGNLGTILRTAAAVGIRDVYLADCADPYGPKCVRSTMGGIYYVDLHEGRREEILSCVRKTECSVVCADMGGKNLFQAKIGKFALVIGSEAHGVSDCFRQAAAVTVKLPMQNVESLNAAVCAGVMLYVLKNVEQGG